MSGGGGKTRLPPPEPPIPTPGEMNIEAVRKGEDLRRKLRKRRGRAATILTEEGGLGGKATLLGDVA